MKILITGYLGLIGSKIYERLKLFHDVNGVDIKEYTDETKHLQLIADLEDMKYDMIIHCGAFCIIRNIIKNPDLAFINIESTYALMEFARKTGCKKVIMLSSSRVEHKEKNPYTVSKQFNENTVETYKQCYGIDYIIIRPETVWGMNDNLVRAIPKWIKQALNNETITIYGDKKKTMPPIYVDDFTDLFLECITHFNIYKGRIIQIAGGTMKVTDIIKLIKKYTKSKSKIKYKKAEKSQPQKVNAENVDSLWLSTIGFEKRLKEVLKR